MNTSSQPIVATTEAPSVTIKRAQEEYKLRGEGSIHQGFRDVIKSLVKSGYAHSIPNDSYADALFLTEIMLEHTDHSFRMLSGGSGDGFLSTLRPTFETMLERLKAAKGTAKIMLIRDHNHPEKDMPCIKDLKDRFPGTLDVATGTAMSTLQHFIVSDSQMLRMEEEHEPLTDDTLASEVKAQVFFDNRGRAKVVETQFDAIWKILRPS